MSEQKSGIKTRVEEKIRSLENDPQYVSFKRLKGCLGEVDQTNVSEEIVEARCERLMKKAEE